MPSAQQRVVCAAVRHVHANLIVCSPRHWDATAHQTVEALISDYADWADAEQGFVDQFGTFLTREEAWKVAVAANQIHRRCGGDGEKLYSENLY